MWLTDNWEIIVAVIGTVFGGSGILTWWLNWRHGLTKLSMEFIDRQGGRLVALENSDALKSAKIEALELRIDELEAGIKILTEQVVRLGGKPNFSLRGNGHQPKERKF
jgi:hypothetical protein